MRPVLAVGLVALFYLHSQTVSAQAPRSGETAKAGVVAKPFDVGTFFVGPSLMLGSLGGAGLALGAEAEFGLSRLTSLSNGVLGLSMRIHTYSAGSSISYLGTTYSSNLRITPVALAANYHFPIEDKRFDPYAGLGLGYAAASYSDNQGGKFTANSGVYVLLDGGLRFGVTPNMALQGGLSLGSRGDVGLLRLAAMLRL